MLNKKVTSVYLSGLMQGISLVAFPAISTILTSSKGFHFSNLQYGCLFIPQVIFAIIASLISTKLNQKNKIRNVFLVGLFANALSMGLLFISYFVMQYHLVSYILVSLATAFLGLGFGLTVPCINTFAGILFPEKTETATLVLNALLGLGTALAPVFVIVFVGLGFWWGLPLVLFIGFIFLFLFSRHLSFETMRHTTLSLTIPKEFWMFALFALIYGTLETINGNWIVVYMNKTLKQSMMLSSLSLASFWGMVTVGRLFFAFLGRFVSEKIIFQILPFTIAFGFLLLSFVPVSYGNLGVFSSGIIGFGCSALLPLVICYANEANTSNHASLTGMIIAFYLMGYGIGAFGAGALIDFVKLPLASIFTLSVLIALFLGLLSYMIIKRQKKLGS